MYLNKAQEKTSFIIFSSSFYMLEDKPFPYNMHIVVHLSEITLKQTHP